MSRDLIEYLEDLTLIVLVALACPFGLLFLLRRGGEKN